MIILVINCGSSSIKYQLLDMKNDDVYDVLAKGLVEKIGLETGCLQHTATGKDKYVIDLPIPDHKVGMKLVLDALTDADHGVLKSLDDIEAVGHRIVHGGEYFSSSALVNEDVMKKIEICCDFAPLHNPAHLLGIRAVQAVLPSVPQVVTFDTAFHQSIPPYAFMYGLPYEDYSKYRVRKYGAHGTSHQFVAEKGAKFAGLDVNNSRIITCHLGNGSSITAVLNGKSIDTSMGFTPLDGVVMGTRCGSIDPAIVTYIMEKKGYTVAQMNDYMNKKCGFAGLSGVGSDSRDVERAMSEGNERAKLTYDVLCYQIKKYVGSYAAAMGGLDAVVFTAGIGEHAPYIREHSLSGLEFLGIELDDEKNTFGHSSTPVEISKDSSRVKVYMIPTNEELVIARDTEEIVKSIK